MSGKNSTFSTLPITNRYPLEDAPLFQPSILDPFRNTIENTASRIFPPYISNFPARRTKHSCFSLPVSINRQSLGHFRSAEIAKEFLVLHLLF
jgi:hypothetical protein